MMMIIITCFLCVGIRERAQKILDSSFPNVQVIDGFKITEWMERYTSPHDGRHFMPLLRLKLSILFTRNQHLLLDGFRPTS